LVTKVDSTRVGSPLAHSWYPTPSSARWGRKPVESRFLASRGSQWWRYAMGATSSRRILAGSRDDSAISAIRPSGWWAKLTMRC